MSNTGDIRHPHGYTTAAYGAPSAPQTDPEQPQIGIDWQKYLGQVSPETITLEPRDVRVTSRVNEEGQLMLKVYVDGKLVAESIADANGTLTILVKV